MVGPTVSKVIPAIALVMVGSAATDTIPGEMVPVVPQLDGGLDGTCDGEDCDARENTVMIDVLSYQFSGGANGAKEIVSNFIGQWEGEKKEGHGIEATSVGEYKGNFADGERSGMGEFRWRPDVGGPGVSYKGFWAKGQMDGLGALTFDNGDRFFGTWKMGMKAGEGFYLTADQMDGVTDASDGRVHLKQAICVYDDGSSYTGQIWAPLKGTPALTADRKAAHKVDPIETVDGECHWVPGTNGKAYEFVKPHGKGVIEYPNGERYAGSWSGGRPHGSGMRISRDGSASYGTWDNGNRVPAIDGQ